MTDVNRYVKGGLNFLRNDLKKNTLVLLTEEQGGLVPVAYRNRSFLGAYM